MTFLGAAQAAAAVVSALVNPNQAQHDAATATPTVTPKPTLPPLTMPCPTCNTDADWHWHITEQGHGTTYTIDCPNCPEEQP
jgi:hypothetical protein